MIGLDLWNYWCALLTYMGCMEMKMGSLETEIVSSVLGELKDTAYVFRSFDQNPCVYFPCAY
jgi:hypothetical protein